MALRKAGKTERGAKSYKNFGFEFFPLLGIVLKNSALDDD